MGKGPDVPGEWDSSGPSEPPAQLLRRAISHVESLLNRLENPADQAAEPPAPAAAQLDPPRPDAPTSGQPTAPERHSFGAEPPETPAPPASADPADNVVELGRTPLELTITDRADTAEVPPAAPNEPAIETAVPQRDFVPDYVPLPGVSSTAQAEALRITLHAHEEAHRLRAEANSLRAEAAAEGERILVEARMLSDRLHVESREGATELLAAAKVEASAIIQAARAEAERITEGAREDSVAVRAALDAQAERDRAAAAREALAEADREADRIRADALDQGRSEAARLVEAEVAAAAIESRRAVEASRSRAEDLLGAANNGIEGVRESMRRLLDEMSQALVAFNASVGSVESLRDAVSEIVPADDAIDATIVEGRRPLGLLFGAPHA